VSRSELALIVGLNAALSLALVLAASWLLPASGQRLATVEREAAAFGEQLDRLVARLPADCRCLVFTQGALIGSGTDNRIADLTPQLRRQLGLEELR